MENLKNIKINIMDNYNEKTEITVIKNSSFTKINKINDILLNIKQFINLCLSGLSLPTNKENLEKKTHEKQEEIWIIKYQQVLEIIENIRSQDISNKTKDQQLIENKIFINTFPAFWYIGKFKTWLITTRLNRINLALKDINIDYFIFNIEVTRFTCRLFQEIFDCLKLNDAKTDLIEYNKEIVDMNKKIMEIIENFMLKSNLFIKNALLNVDDYKIIKIIHLLKIIIKEQIKMNMFFEKYPNIFNTNKKINF